MALFSEVLGVQKRKQEVTKVVSFVKMAGNMLIGLLDKTNRLENLISKKKRYPLKAINSNTKM